MQKQKSVVCGLGEIGKPIFDILSKKTTCMGYDLNSKLIPKYSAKFDSMSTIFLHICIPFTKKFDSNIQSLCKKFSPKIVVIHSTVPPNTTQKLQKKLVVPIIYSATRGIHKRMNKDIKRYTKFFAIDKNVPNANWASKKYSTLMKQCGIKSKQMSDTVTLELAKIVVDTSYYGWLINYAQLSNIIAQKYGIDYDEMWSFADEIHKFLGNRPKMFPGFIGGHCVIPNLKLMQDESLFQIDTINNMYARKLKHNISLK